MRSLTLPQLASVAIRATLADAGVDPQEVEELVLGVNLPGSDRSIARQTLLQSGIPDSRNAFTVDRACCSSLTAVSLAQRAVLSEEIEFAIAGGAENLSRVPYFLEDMRWGHRLGSVTLADQLVISCPHTQVPRAIQASEEAALFGIDRVDQDQWAHRSQTRYWSAADKGFFDQEIAPVDLALFGSSGDVETDESPRKTTLESLAALPAVNGSDSVTAGNAPGLSTGAAAILLTSRRVAEQRDLSFLATLVSHARASGPPANIASIPAVAAQLALDRAGIGLDRIDRIEINEAFAAVPLVSTLLLANRDEAAACALRERTNVNGGAVALGHPTGATGVRLLQTAALELRRRVQGEPCYALVSMCGGIGEGEAFVIRVDPDQD